MPLKRDRLTTFVMMAAGLVMCWLGPESVQAAAAKTGVKPPRVTAREPRGLCDAPFSLKFTTGSKDAVIRYTLDGTAPTFTNGDVYATPLKVSKTTLLRAAAFDDSGVGLYSDSAPATGQR